MYTDTPTFNLGERESRSDRKGKGGRKREKERGRQRGSD